MPSEASSSGHGQQGLAAFGLAMRCLQTRQVTTGAPFFGDVHGVKAALSRGLLESSSREEKHLRWQMELRRWCSCLFFLCQCMFAQAKQNPVRITLLLAYIRHSSQNRPRILSSVQRKNVLFQSVNLSLFSYRMIVSWSKHAALGQAPDHKAAFGMRFPPGTL